MYVVCLDSAVISRLHCKQLQEKSKQTMCFWNTYSENSLTMGIYDSHGRERKLLNVTGGFAALEAQEMDFGELYIITLCNIQTTQTLFGMSDNVQVLLFMHHGRVQ